MKHFFWSKGLLTVDAAKTKLKRSTIMRTIPLLRYTYLLEISRAIVIPELKLCFVPIPKVANRSMRAAIMKVAYPNFEGDPYRMDWQYTPVALLRDNDCFRFGFVRNPLDRLLSCYTHQIVLHKRQMGARSDLWRYGKQFHPAMSFEEFVHVVARIPDRIADTHFRSQHMFLYHGGELMVDFVGRFENLAHDWNVIRDRFGLPALKHYNRTSHPDHRSAYTPELARVAMERYAKDIELFGYEGETTPH